MKKESLTYKITDKTLLHISKIEHVLAIISQNEVALHGRMQQQIEILFDDLFALNSSLKLNLSLGEVKKISLGKDVDSKEAILLSNAKGIFDFINNNYKKNDIVFNFHLVQHVVKLLQSNILELWEVGKIRSGEDEVDKSFELPNQKYANSSDIVNTLEEGVVWVEVAQVHPIIKACVFLVFLNELSPFTGLNFVSSIIFFRIILEKYGYGDKFHIPLYKILNPSNYSFKELISKCLNGNQGITVTEIVENVSARLEEILMDYKKEFVHYDYRNVKSESNTLDLNERQMKLLKLLQEKVSIRRREYIKLFRVSPMTAYRDLNFLIQKKLLILSGTGKSTTYTLYTKA